MGNNTQVFSMEQRLYPASKIGAACGVSRQYITRYVKEHCQEAKSGTKIDINHPVMSAFMESKGADMSKQLKPAEQRTSHLATTPVSQSESKLAKSRRDSGTSKPRQKLTSTQNKTVEEIDISDHGNLTLNEIIAYFGSDESYRGFLDAKKKQIEIVEKELKVQKTKGEVIDRDFVSNHLFGVIQEMTSRMLVDYPRKIVEMIYAHCESGDTKEDAEATVREELGKPIKAAKAQVVKRIGENNG